MYKIIYDVPLLKQGSMECVQATLAQLMQFYKFNKSVEDIKKEVKVYVNDQGVPLGTTYAHAGILLLKYGFKVTFHTVDIEIFDRSWVKLSKKEIIEKLSERKKFIKHYLYGKKETDFSIDGFIEFLKNGGEIIFPVIDENYLKSLLQEGPIFASGSYNFLNEVAKYKFAGDDYVQDDIQGHPTAHAFVIAGFKDNEFLIIDPDKDFGGKKWIKSGHLIGSIYLAETDYGSCVITVKQ